MAGDRLQILIEVAADGSVQVTGPIENKLLCYGAFEMAKEAVRKHHEQQEKKRIVPAVMPMPSGIGRG